MTDEYDDDIVLSELDDEELVLQMHYDLYYGLREEIEEGTNILLARGWPAKKVLDEALVAGMAIVGVDFRDGETHGVQSSHSNDARVPPDRALGFVGNSHAVRVGVVHRGSGGPGSSGGPAEFEGALGERFCLEP